MVVIATASEMEKHFEKYLHMVINGNEVVVTKDGLEVGRFVPEGKTGSYLTDSLTGILKGNCDMDDVREKSLREKHANMENE